MSEQDKFKRYFDEHIGTVFARQMRFASFMGEQSSVQMDLEKGSVDFGDGRLYTVQLLGTQLENEDAWLWAWSDDNEPSFAQKALIDAQQIKKTGHEQNIEQFAHDKLILELSSVPLVPDEFNGEYIASIAAGMFNTVYWRSPFENGKNAGMLYFLVKELPAEFFEPFTVPDIMNAIEDACSYYQMEDKTMTEYFLQQQGFTTQWKKNLLQADRGSENIVATFNKKDHSLEEIEAHGFEGEENYQDNEDGDFDGWMEEEEEFPPRM